MRDYRHRTYPPASDAEVAAFEQRLGVDFCADYKAFLRTDNGLEVDERFALRDLDDWIYHVHRLFGGSAEQSHGVDGELDGFFDRRYLPICYPIGIDHGGNLLLQIAAGARRGQLAMLDHEVWHGGMRELLDVADGLYPDDDEERDPLPFQTFADATPDQVLDECFKVGFLAHYPVGLAEHLENLDRLLNRLAEENRNRPKTPVPAKAELKSAFLHLVINGAWQAVEELSTFQGQEFVVGPAEALAWHVRIVMEETRAIRTSVVFTAPGGGTLRSYELMLETNGTFRLKAALTQNGVEPTSGSYGIAVSFPDDPVLPVLTDTREILIGRRPRGFTSAQFKPASETEIDAFEAGLPYRFCDDFRAWLMEANGIQFQWPYIKLWDGLADDVHATFKAEVAAQAKTHWELAVHDLNGLQKSWPIRIDDQAGPRWVESARGLEKDFANRLNEPRLQLLYPVAGTIASDSHGYCQIAAGARRGQIVELKAHKFGLDRLADVQDGQRVTGRGKKAKTLRDPFRSFAEAMPDQVIDAWLDEGMIAMMGLDFAAFAARVIEVHEQEFARLFTRYVTGPEAG
ncbi:SMI1/KNR4 family protein [Bosea sp. NPDC055332]